MPRNASAHPPTNSAATETWASLALRGPRGISRGPTVDRSLGDARRALTRECPSSCWDPAADRLRGLVRGSAVATEGSSRSTPERPRRSGRSAPSSAERTTPVTPEGHRRPAGTPPPQGGDSWCFSAVPQFSSIESNVESARTVPPRLRSWSTNERQSLSQGGYRCTPGTSSWIRSMRCRPRCGWHSAGPMRGRWPRTRSVWSTCGATTSAADQSPPTWVPPSRCGDVGQVVARCRAGPGSGRRG